MSQKKAATTGILLLVGIEAIILVEWASFPYWPAQAMFLGNGHDFVYAVLMPLSPLLLVGVLYGTALAYAVRRARRSRSLGPQARYFTEPIASQVRRLRSIYLKDSTESVAFLKYPRFLLVLGVVLSWVLAYMPYRPDINPLGALVGVDSPLYEEWLSQMLNRPLADAVSYAFTGGTFGSRPFLLLPLYVVVLLGNLSPHSAVQFLPLLLGPALCIACFLFVRFGSGKRGLAGLTALFTAVSFNFTVGMWGGYYANWLALAESYLFLMLLLSITRSISFPKYAGLMALSLVLLFTHPWTWALVLAVSMVFSLSVIRDAKNPAHAWLTGTLILVGVAVDFFRSLSFGARSLAEDLATKSSIFGFSELARFWPNAVDSVLYIHDGLMTNPVFIGVALISILALSFRDHFQRLLMLWVLVPSVPFALFESYHQARILYDLPIPVLMAMGTLQLAYVGKGSLRWPTVFILLIAIFALNYALRAMFQL